MFFLVWFFFFLTGELTCDWSTEAPSKPERREDTVLALPHTLIHTHTPSPSPFSSLTWCECHVVLLRHVCMCGSKWWWSLSFLCDGGGKEKPALCVVCCVIWSLALTVTNIRPPAPTFSVANVWWSCMQSVPSDTWTWKHESHSAKSPLLGLPLLLHHHNY